MKKLCFFLLIVCFALAGRGSANAQEEIPKAQLFDAYGEVNSEDASARLDNFVIQLQNDANVDAYVIGYGPEGDGSGTGNYLIEVTKNYLVNMRGVEAERIQTINGGRYKNPAEIETELWLVPHGAKPPEPKHYKSKPKKINGKFIEYTGWDGIPDGADGPSLGNVTLASFADALRQQSDSTAYIAAFNVHDPTPGTWRRIAKSIATDLQSYGIKDDRIKIIYGGTLKKSNKEYEDAQSALIQLWILPKDAPPPVKEAKPEATPKKAVLIGTYQDYSLKYREQERTIFNGFADVLRADGQLNVYIVTRPRIEALEKILPDEPLDIDPIKLADEWKTELIEKSGIKTNRITVINATADELRQGEIEVWVAPPGVALPSQDTFADEMPDNETLKNF